MGYHGSTAAQFVAAWRLIHRLFAAAHATNVIWVWNTNVISAEPQLDLSAYYPGDAYVDWVGVTGYFAASGPDTFDGLYGPTMREIRGFTTKPFIIAETSVQTGPDQVAAAQNLVSGGASGRTCSVSSGSTTTRAASTGGSSPGRRCGRPS